MRQAGNACAAMIAEEARVIYDQQAESGSHPVVAAGGVGSAGRALEYPGEFLCHGMFYSQTMAAHALRAAETICAAIEAYYRAQGESALLAPDAE